MNDTSSFEEMILDKDKEKIKELEEAIMEELKKP